MSKIPKSWTDFTPQVLTPIIAARHPGAVVSEVALLEGTEGTSSRALFELTYSAGSGPRTLFAKTQGDLRRRIVHVMTGNLYNEALLFADEVALPVDHPVIYRAVVDRLHLNEMIVMEDLRNRDVVLHHAATPLSVDTVAAGLTALARLHSAYWEYTRKSAPAISWVKPWKPTRSFHKAVRDYGAKGMERMRDRMPQQVASMTNVEMAEWWARFVRSAGTGPTTLLHGDAHIGNTYSLPDGQVGFVDWAVVRRGSWVHDAGYFVTGSLTIEDRRSHAADLIEGYRTALEVPEAQRPSRDEAWLRFRSCPPYGLGVWLATGGGGGWRTPEICGNLVERYATAFDDLDTPSALAALPPASGKK